MEAATGPDQLRVTSGGTEARFLNARNALQGLRIVQVAGRNGPGLGEIRSRARAGGLTDFGWVCPGGTIPGWSTITLDGDHLLVSGDDNDNWCRVNADVSEFGTPGRGVEVELADDFNNAVTGVDITAAGAASGGQDTWSVLVQNDGSGPCLDVVVWLDAAVSGMEISPDNAAWSSPTTEATGILLGDIAGGGTAFLYFRRTIGVGAPSNDKVLNQVELAFTPF